MTDFDQKLAELEANSDRVPELKMVVELLRMLRPPQKVGDYVVGAKTVIRDDPSDKGTTFTITEIKG